MGLDEEIEFLGDVKREEARDVDADVDTDAEFEGEHELLRGVDEPLEGVVYF